MKLKVAPWKINVCGVVLAACYKVRPGLTWMMAQPDARRDTSVLRVGDGSIITELEVNLRTIWKEGKRRQFAYLQQKHGELMAKYYAALDAKKEAVSA